MSEEGNIFDAATFRETMGDADLMLEVISGFEDECRSAMENLAAACSGDDAGAVHEAAHFLKGLFGTMCAAKAEACAAELDQVARDGDLEQARRVHAALEGEAGRLREALAGFGESLKTSAP